nr:immunoglobulin heavy chain junction region [Macaca mulatta]MOW75606.1 immunoglobulin heavy chain junction region [Macaca mulatta]MOW76250.1 immunoglobulin heavy chain junction region [Macaca mulatta]MOW76636.1 immunoglobulin heavy chain junction region [Macaca mulatta]MOW77203.1 immunoglobulin heavy chain junction region [Macaca mulatta]
CAESGNFPFYW